MSKLVAGTLVSILYPDKNGILVTRKGRFEKTLNDGKSIVLFVGGNGQYLTLDEDKISNLQIISTIYVVRREYYEMQADLVLFIQYCVEKTKTN